METNLYFFSLLIKKFAEWNVANLSKWLPAHHQIHGGKDFSLPRSNQRVGSIHEQLQHIVNNQERSWTEVPCWQRRCLPEQCAGTPWRGTAPVSQVGRNKKPHTRLCVMVRPSQVMRKPCSEYWPARVAYQGIMPALLSTTSFSNTTSNPCQKKKKKRKHERCYGCRHYIQHPGRPSASRGWS